MGIHDCHRTQEVDRFIHMYAILAADLTKLLKKDEPYEWGEKQQSAFEALKAKLTTAPVLRSPDWDRPFHVYVDTSAFAIGVVLSQKDDNKKDYPIYFASRQLSLAERKYTTTEREALGMVYSCKKFRHYLICYEFVFYVDHYALQHLVKKADLFAGVHLYSTDQEGCSPRKRRLPIQIVDPAYRGGTSG
ncbi:hypothetical protein AXG93_4905s1460 [Marchantia polymorpha subsp. ruderalis]|uniref:Reverse transcriptase/retrotransposon-derived protein RNase H-like domain-containing protein n=1 Tax=Marchantia polymorpha subsp. ruderalis TaxID=1480154 RepID=A0A176VL03_MARPO|nr:hypothetical protein AXG93_4905s1460 [Marchantia polymorpha subsp. ruderalis]